MILEINHSVSTTITTFTVDHRYIKLQSSINVISFKGQF